MYEIEERFSGKKKGERDKRRKGGRDMMKTYPILYIKVSKDKKEHI